MISVKQISGGYYEKNVIHDVSFHVKKGELFGIIGPNGSGKTTLLNMLGQVLVPSSGDIQLKGQSLSTYAPIELAKLIAVLPQHMMQTFSYTVRETVALGRYAHQQGIFRSLTTKDEQLIHDVMEQTGVIHYEHVPIDRLSGGERQRVFLAQALAQDPQILLLDEPTNHLDLSYQKELLDVLKKWTREKKLTVIAIFHDLNLASLYCDRLLLLDKGQKNICDLPGQVLQKSRIESVYQTAVENHPHPKIPKPQMMILPNDHVEDTQTINAENLKVSKNKIVLQSSTPLKTMSSGITGSGVGWYRTFVNRYVSEDYNCTDFRQDMVNYLKKHEFSVNETVSMMTAVNLRDVVYKFLDDDHLSVFIVVTASTGYAIDASAGKKRPTQNVGTINTWIFVNGYLSEEAFIQTLTTATESKVRALMDLQITDSLTKTQASGTGTDSILVAATQRGANQQFAGPLTPLGRLVGKGVYYCTKRAIEKYFQRHS